MMQESNVSVTGTPTKKNKKLAPLLIFAGLIYLLQRPVKFLHKIYFVLHWNFVTRRVIPSRYDLLQ